MSIDARVDVTTEVTQEETPKVLTVSQLEAHIKEDGMSREEIRKKYGMTIAEAKEIFSHPKLKGIRVKKQKVMRIQLIDDTAPAVIQNQIQLQDAIAQLSPSTDNTDENRD